MNLSPLVDQSDTEDLFLKRMGIRISVNWKVSALVLQSLKGPGNEMIILPQVFVVDSITINRDIKKIIVQMTSFVFIDLSVSSMNGFAPVT